MGYSFAQEFANRTNKVVLANFDNDVHEEDQDEIIVHSFNPASPIFKEALGAYKFDLVIFFGDRENYETDDGDTNPNQSLDALVNVLELSVSLGVNRFFYVSTSEVFGDAELVEEDVEPKPVSLNGQLLFASEGICDFFHHKFDLPITVIRTPFLFDEFKTDLFFFDLIEKSSQAKEVVIPAKEDLLCDFLHIKDLADFIRRVLEDDFSPQFETVNLSSNKPISFLAFTEMLREFFLDTKYSFSGENEISTRAMVGNEISRKYGWAPLHSLDQDLPGIIERYPVKKTIGTPGLLKRGINFYRSTKIIRWFELFLGAILMQFLSDFTGTLVQFRYVDFRLLFVVLMGSVYGIRFGLYASVLASLSILYTWYELSINWALLTYNIGNWFPFFVYFVAGVVTGYYRDKIENERTQKELIYDKYAFLYRVFNEISDLKDEFRQQLIRYRDSFGKMYKITSELDSLQPEAVFYKSLTVLEEVMANNSIAIYSIDPTKKFLRLEVNSQQLNGNIAKSVKLADMPELVESIEKSEIFQNQELLPEYPAYAAPIYKDNVPTAFVMVWEANFSMFSKYYFNLFKVVTYLIQDSLSRASLFREATSDQNYVTSTHILRPGAFKEALLIKSKMKQSDIANYQILKIEHGDSSPEEMYATITKGIRTADLIGLWDDGNYYILLNQADNRSVDDIVKRLATYEITSECVDSHEFVKNLDRK